LLLTPCSADDDLFMAIVCCDSVAFVGVTLFAVDVIVIFNLRVPLLLALFLQWEDCPCELARLEQQLWV